MRVNNESFREREQENKGGGNYKEIIKETFADLKDRSVHYVRVPKSTNEETII